MSKKQKKITVANTKSKDYSVLILIVLTVLCYLRVLGLDLTQLDDTIFINDKHTFISSYKNIPVAFTQGCFSEKDIYYRPILLVYFILLNPFTSQTSITVYHFGNLVFHVINVLLVFKLLNKLTKNRIHSFWLSVLFAVHPVFTMAVAWIPGINDLLLTTFALGYFLALLKVFERGQWKEIVLNTLFLFLGLFTKETGAFLPIGGLLLLWYNGYLKRITNAVKLTIILNVAVWLTWFIARKDILMPGTPALIDQDMLSTFFYKLNGLIQYFGKCILPFNLNVFPTIENTNTFWAIAALLLVGIMIVLNKNRKTNEIIFGITWFILFLLPIFFVPKNINNQFFEHRLYLPMIGILFLFRQTILFALPVINAIRKTILIVLCIIWILIIHLYIPDFKETFSFWNSAVAASPDNAYANKMLGIKLEENNRQTEAIPYIKKAYSLDSTEKYTRLFIAKLIYMPGQKWDSARWMLEREIETNPTFQDTYAELSHVCFEMKDFPAAEKNLIKFLEFQPREQMFNTNLLLLYRDQGKYKQALLHADKMKELGLTVDEGLYKILEDSSNIPLPGF